MAISFKNTVGPWVHFVRVRWAPQSVVGQLFVLCSFKQGIAPWLSVSCQPTISYYCTCRTSSFCHSCWMRNDQELSTTT